MAPQILDQDLRGRGAGGPRNRPSEEGGTVAKPSGGGAEPAPRPGGLGLWIRRRRTRSHLAYLPKWTARRAEPFGVRGLHWLPAPIGSRDPALLLHGGAGTILAVAEISPGVLRGPESGDLGVRLGGVLGRPAPPYGVVTRLQILNQVPGPAGRTRCYVIIALAYTPGLVSEAAQFAQGERGLTVTASRGAAEVFAALAADGAHGARLGPLVPLDRASVTGLLGALVLPGRGVAGMRLGFAWQPTEIDARSPRSVAMTGPAGTAGQSTTWWHATGWVKKWPRAVGGIDVAAGAALLPPGVSGASSLVMGMSGPPHDRAPAVSGYVTVSGHDATEVELARAAAHRIAEQREGFIEFCDRRHHLAFAHTLPLATGLRA